jgi:hypothetical protein
VGDTTYVVLSDPPPYQALTHTDRRLEGELLAALIALGEVPMPAMRWADVGDLTCSVARTLSVVGGSWTLMLLRDAFLSVGRFEPYEAVGPRRGGRSPNRLVEVA